MWFVLGLLVGMHIGFAAWWVYVWLTQLKHYLAAIKQNSGRESSVIKAPTIQPISGQGTSPNVVKPRTPKQMALDKLKQMKGGQ